MESLGPIIGPIGILAVLGWWLKILVTNIRLQRTIKVQAEFQKIVLEKFESPDELKAYLQSDVGSKLLQTVAPEKGSPYGKILGSIQSGLILSLGGLAILFIRGGGSVFSNDESVALLFLGGLALALGIGFLLSAMAAYWLSRSWGLVNGQSNANN